MKRTYQITIEFPDEIAEGSSNWKMQSLIAERIEEISKMKLLSRPKLEMDFHPLKIEQIKLISEEVSAPPRPEDYINDFIGILFGSQK